MSLSTNIQVQVSGQLASTVGLQAAQAALSYSKAIAFDSGVGASQADRIYTNSYAIGTGATQSIDVSGSLTDALGGTFVLVKLKAILIYSQPANTTNLTVLGDAASVPILNTAATTFTLQPGGLFLLVQPPLAGIAVTGATGDVIKLVNAAGATANVDVVIVGASA
jgi:hypothetical protein